MGMMQRMQLFFKKVISKLPVLLFDVIAIPISWYTAYCLRYNLQPFSKNFWTANSFLALFLLINTQLVCYYYFKTYRGLWRFASLADVLRILKASISTLFLVIPLFYLTSILQSIPRSVLPLYALLLTTLLCGGRVVARLYWDRKARGVLPLKRKKVLIIGAGLAGESLVRDLKRNQYYYPVGFVDDNLAKRGLEVHGVPVLGTLNQLQHLVHKEKVDLIFIALPSANSATMRSIVMLCESCHIPFRTLPSLSALASGRVEVNALRAVNIEDLLGRDEVHLEWDKVKINIREKRVLITGGGGSIGSELCRQIITFKPASLAIIESSEFNLYQIENELNEKFPFLNLKIYLASITDEVAMKKIFAEFLPELVFHAAAYKHVPMLQNQIRVSVLNNVIGTQIVAKISSHFEVEKFILISTDKAVNPTNIMGTTKRVAEIYCQNFNQFTKTQFITVRFGNVLGSAGSVLPLFQKQLLAGGPITVTHPEMERFFMTIPEACQLILQAMANGSGGEIFVLDMGEPIKISYLAEQLIRLAGKEPNKDIFIEYTGLRPGEKLFEELFHESEYLVSTEHEKLFQAQFRELNWDDLLQTLSLMQRACEIYQEDELLILLKSLVPELQALEFLPS